MLVGIFYNKIVKKCGKIVKIKKNIAAKDSNLNLQKESIKLLKFGTNYNFFTFKN